MATIVGDTIRDVGSTINAVDPLKWFYVPMLIVFMLFMIILFAFVIDVNSPLEGTSCTGSGFNSVCKPVKYSGWYKALIAILFSGIFSYLVGRGTYMVGLSIYNPKAAAAIFGTVVIKEAIFNQ
jgi:hypothetical protein